MKSPQVRFPSIASNFLQDNFFELINEIEYNEDGKGIDCYGSKVPRWLD
jgi:hypothetical protein